MYLTASFDQEYCHALGINSDYGHLIDLIIKLPSWAKYADDEGMRYYFIDYGKIIKELPVIFKSKSKITRIIKELEERSIISIIKVGRSYYIKPDESLIFFWKKSKFDRLDSSETNRSKNRTFQKWNDYVLKSERIVLKSEPIRTPAISTPMISTPIEKKQNSSKTKTVDTKKTWEFYAKAYLERHNSDCLRNAMVNTQMKKFVQMVGAKDSPYIAQYYLSLNDSWYLKKYHDVGSLLQNAQAIRTQWLNQTNRTTIDHRNTERQSSTLSAVNSVKQKIARGEL